MTRVIFISVFAMLVWAGLAVSSVAQAGGTNLTPLPVGEQGWCTVTADTPAG